MHGDFQTNVTPSGAVRRCQKPRDSAHTPPSPRCVREPIAVSRSQETAAHPTGAQPQDTQHVNKKHGLEGIVSYCPQAASPVACTARSRMEAKLVIAGMGTTLCYVKQKGKLR